MFLFLPSSFCLGDAAFSEYFFGTITVLSLYGEYVQRFPITDGVFLSCDHGLDFYISLLCEKLIQSTKRRESHTGILILVVYLAQ